MSTPDVESQQHAPEQRGILSLAGPALVVLAAEPLYLLVDTAVVGHLGGIPLAGLAIGGALFGVVATLCNFLAYGTTGRVARLHGQGRRAEALVEGVQASWIALGLGWRSCSSCSSWPVR